MHAFAKGHCYKKYIKMNELIALFNYWIQFCKRVLDLNYSLLFYDLCLFASYPQSIRKLYLVLCYPERICQIGMTYLCSLGTETEIFSVSLLTKKPFFWQVYFITSVLVFGMSHNIMFLLCVTKGQKILFLFKEVEKLSSVLMYFER